MEIELYRVGCFEWSRGFGREIVSMRWLFKERISEICGLWGDDIRLEIRENGNN